MSSFIKTALNYLPTGHKPQPKNDIQFLMEKRCYYTVNSSEPNDDALLFLLPEQDCSVKTASSNEKVVSILKKHKKIDQKVQEQGTFRRDCFARFLKKR